MKKVYVIALIAFVCLGGIGISAHAQDTEGVVVQVPFEFIAGGSTMPAGKYTIGRLSPDSSSNSTPVKWPHWRHWPCSLWVLASTLSTSYPTFMLPWPIFWLPESLHE